MTVIRTRRLHLGKHLRVYNSCYGLINPTSNNKSIKHMKDECLIQLHTVLHAYIEGTYYISTDPVLNVLIVKEEWECLEF
jgi:hypothetical protein